MSNDVYGCGEPRCNLIPRRQPTDAERKAAKEHEHAPLPPSWDTATPEQIAEHGPAYDCAACGQTFRLKTPPVKPAPRPA